MVMISLLKKYPWIWQDNGDCVAFLPGHLQARHLVIPPAYAQAEPPPGLPLNGGGGELSFELAARTHNCTAQSRELNSGQLEL